MTMTTMTTTVKSKHMPTPIRIPFGSVSDKSRINKYRGCYTERRSSRVAVYNFRQPDHAQIEIVSEAGQTS